MKSEANIDDKTLCRFGVLPALKRIKHGVNGQLYACCPFHEDERQSFSVNRETGLWSCHAGCGSGNAVQFYSRLKGLVEGEAYKQLVELGGARGSRNSNKRRVVATYDYHDEEGKLLFQTVRFEPKGFAQRRPSNEDWIWNLKDVRRVLYRLPELLAADPREQVFICEGEKDADRLWSLGIPATTNPGGAGKWQNEYSRALENKKVVILPDHDKAGEDHAIQVARSLTGIASSVKIVHLPGLPPKGDISDWLDAGHTKEELAEAVRAASALRTEDLPPDREPKSSALQLTSLKNLLSEPEEAVSWLVDGLLPSAGFSLLAAKPKVGKSTLARNLALCVARGQEFLGRSTNRGAVIYLALEEKRSEVRKHFLEMGATGEEEIYVSASGAPKEAIEEILNVAEKMKPSLIVIDPLFRLTRVKDANDYAQVTAALEPILMLARQTGAHVLCVHHTNKGQNSDGDSILGSTAIFGAVDSAIILKRTDRYRTIKSIQRYGEDLEETVLRFDPKSRMTTLGESKDREEISRMEQAILDFLKSQEEPLSEKQIKDSVEGNNRHKQDALRELVSDEKLAKQGKGTKGDPYKYSLSHFSTIQKCESENFLGGLSRDRSGGNAHFDTSPLFESAEVRIQPEDTESFEL